MSAAGLAGVYAIPPGGGFLDDLARGLCRAYPPETLARTKVYLPTRRACRELTEAFLALPGPAGLLPAAYPLGDVDGDDLAFLAAEPALAAVEATTDLPPAVSPIRRNFMLARLAQAKHRAEHGTDLPLAAAMRLAEALVRFLDELAIERVEPETIRSLDAGGYAEHWRRVLAFLEIVLEAWPALLKEEDRMDPAARREALLDAQAEAWTLAPPQTPLIVAGSTGAAPSTRSLMTAALAAPLGAVVLPGFDSALDAADLEAVLETPTHPQHAMACALRDMKIDVGTVRPWPGDRDSDSVPRVARRRLAAEALRPATRVAAWADLPNGAFAAATPGLVRVDAPNEDMEARAIAIFLREHAEQPGARVALATPDRTLARRVAAELRRWDIAADDSAGRPLAETAVGAFLRLVARAFRPGAGAVDRLALLKHPLAGGGMGRARFRRRARALERDVWRDEALQRRATSFDAAATALETTGRRDHGQLARFARHVAGLAAPLVALGNDEPRAFGAFLAAHIAVAEAFAATDAAPGDRNLWQADDGEAAADLLADALDAADAAPMLRAADYADAFDALAAGAAVRPRRGEAGGVAILGVLEARLGRYDAIALSGLDEGVWPRAPAADPWFSRGMRREIGLSDPDRRVGLSAHDFAQHLAAPHVLLARSQRRDGAPTKPSRWLERLAAALKATGDAPIERGGQKHLNWAAGLDPELPAIVIPDPAPRPAVSARPRRLSVTRIKLLRDDPYAVYARHVLGLRALKPLDPPPSPADRGRIVHAAFEAFYRAWPESLPDDIAAELRATAEAAFGDLAGDPAIAAFWRPAFDRAVLWASDMERARRRDLQVARVEAEVRGEATLDAPAGPFVLDARADRVDRLADGALAIVDIKTGAEPTRAQLLDAREPQMPLEAAIARYGGFGADRNRAVRELAIWKVGGQSAPKAVAIADGAVDRALDAAWDGLSRMIAAFDDPTTPYLSEPRGIQGFSDYRALARRSEDVEERA